MTEKNNNWQNRIVGYKQAPANELLANPMNARSHPPRQREALRGSLDTLGWVSPILVNARTNMLIDGHARVEEMLTKDENALIPVIEVDITEDEEKLFLASFDWITQLADYDRDRLDDLLHEVQTDDTRLQAMLSEMAERTGVIFADDNSWGDAFEGIPDSDRAPFQQKTFTLHDSQIEIIDNAIRLANSIGGYDDTPNDNSNGNALTRICEAYLESHG